MAADAITFERTAVTGKIPVFYGAPKKLPGSFKLKQTFANGTLIPKSTPIQLDFDLMEAGVVKLAKVLAGGNTTSPRVTKGSLLAVGDTVMKIGKTDLSVTVSSIVTTNASYDVVTLSAAVATLTTGDFLQESTTAGAAVTEVKGLYTFTMGTNATAADVLHFGGIDYTFAAAAAENVILVGGTALASVANLEDAISAQYEGIFSVAANGAKLKLTQLVGGTGVIPVVTVTQTGGGTLVASIAETTEGVAGVLADADPLYVADAVIEQDKTYDTNGSNDIAAAYEALVLKGGAYPVPASFLTGFGLTANQSIKYINQ